MNEQRIHERESQFHDDWASSADISNINVRSAFESPTAMENRFILEKLGPLQGKRIVDIGAGLAESSVYFALAGADVTCTDISPGMVATAKRLAELHGARIDGVACAAEKLDLPSSAFDVAYVANVIHHVPNKAKLFEEIRRVLTPGGLFVSIDPLTYNPIIKLYRRMATEVRTEDERPLSFGDVQLVQRYFVGVGHREFWIASLALFLKYYAIDRIHPNQDRYWKRIYKESDHSLTWWKPLRWLDTALTRIPLVRRLAWNMVMWGNKALAPEGERAAAG